MGCFSDILKGSIIVNLLITESVQIERMLNNKGEFYSLCEWENYKRDTPLNPPAFAGAATRRQAFHRDSTPLDSPKGEKGELTVAGDVDK
jgi:hypothetical protein